MFSCLYTPSPTSATPPASPSSSTSCPIHRIPKELIIQIFEHYLHNDSSDIFWCPSPSSVFLLSHVCSRWLRLATRTPTLWTRIRITVKPNRRFFLQVLTLFIKRASGCPIDLHVTIVEPRGTGVIPEMMMSTMLHYISQWRHVTFHIFAPTLLPDLFKLPDSRYIDLTPKNLRAFEMCYYGTGSSKPATLRDVVSDYDFPFLLGANELHTIHITIPNCYAKHISHAQQLQWDKLHTVRIDSQARAHQCLDILRHATHLRSAHFRLHHFWELAGLDTEFQDVSHAQLQHISLIVSQDGSNRSIGSLYATLFLNTLTLPALKSIALYDVTELEVGCLAVVVSRSACYSVRELTLSCHALKPQSLLVSINRLAHSDILCRLSALNLIISSSKANTHSRHGAILGGALGIPGAGGGAIGGRLGRGGDAAARWLGWKKVDKPDDLIVKQVLSSPEAFLFLEYLRVEGKGLRSGSLGTLLEGRKDIKRIDVVGMPKSKRRVVRKADVENRIRFY